MENIQLGNPPADHGQRLQAAWNLGHFAAQLRFGIGSSSQPGNTIALETLPWAQKQVKDLALDYLAYGAHGRQANPARVKDERLGRLAEQVSAFLDSKVGPPNEFGAVRREILEQYKNAYLMIQADDDNSRLNAINSLQELSEPYRITNNMRDLALADSRGELTNALAARLQDNISAFSERQYLNLGLKTQEFINRMRTDMLGQDSPYADNAAHSEAALTPSEKAAHLHKKCTDLGMSPPELPQVASREASPENSISSNRGLSERDRNYSLDSCYFSD
jgi:hypothetical protein